MKMTRLIYAVSAILTIATANVAMASEQVGQLYGTGMLTYIDPESDRQVTDVLHKRGYHDANLRIATFAALLAIPFLFAVPAVTSPTLAIALLAPGMFFGTVPFS